MKKASPHKRTGRPKLPGFFDHFFYWMWRSCRHGFPDRSFVVISVVQFACLLFPVAVVLQFLDSPSVRFLYETDNRLTLFPLILPFPILLWRNMRIYTEERYRMMHDFYGAFHVSVRQRYRLRFLVCTVLAVLAILLEYGCSPFIMTVARPYPQATAIPQAFMSHTGMTMATIPCRKAFTASSMKKGVSDMRTSMAIPS